MDTQPTPESTNDDELRFAPRSENTDTEFADSLDIDAALAAVASLDDMLAEQEAAEQARIAHEEAEAEAQAQRQARLKNPEQFFAMPSLATLQRGRLDSLIPAFVFIGIGAWLTLTITSGAAPNPALSAIVVFGGLSVILLTRWIVSGRWAGGNLFFGLLVLLLSGAVFVVVNSIGLAAGWPLLLIALGAAFILTGFLVQPSQRRLIFPGVVVIFAGVVAYLLTSGLIVLSWRG